jgi:hypothetical protein
MPFSNNSGHIGGFMITVALNIFAHITNSDIAIVVTIAAGCTTIAINLKNLRKK